MDQKYYYQLGLIFFLVVLLFWVGMLFSGGGQLLLRRGLFGAILLFGGVLLSSQLAVIPAIFAISADYISLVPSPNSFTLLTWALFLGLPYIVSLIREKRAKETSSEPVEATSEPAEKRLNSESVANFESQNQSSESRPDETVEKAQELLLHRFQQAADSLELANLIYFHVRNQQATFGYKINNYGKLNTDISFTPDIGQSVGWVLRHEESLNLQGQSLDWRNLQYHSKPVDLHRVQFEPVFSGEELIGVLVFEWQTTDLPAEAAVEAFCDEVQKLFSLDYSVRQLVKKQQKLTLMEKLYTVNPLAADDFEGTINKVLEFVSSYLPAENANFFPMEASLSEVSPPARRKIFEHCRRWIKNSGEILRVEDVGKETLAGNSLDKFGQAEMSSFLGGRICSESGPYGFIFLDAAETGYFTREDEQIFALLLDYLEHLLEIATSVREAREQRNQLNSWLEELSRLELKDEPARQGEKLVELLHDGLSNLCTALYWRNNSVYDLVSYSGKQEPSLQVDPDSSLVNGISGTDRALLSFPDVDKFSSFEAPLDTEALAVHPISSGTGKLEGFVAHCLDSKKQLESARFDLIDRTAGLLNKWLIFNNRSYRYKLQSATDSLTSCRNYSPWMKEVKRILSQDPEEVLFWELWVPGQEKVGNACGRKKTVNWLRSITRLLRDKLADSIICRPYGAVFYGFDPRLEVSAEERLESIQTELMGWNFPAGEWPGEVEYEFSYFASPYPKVEQILDGLHYARNRED